MMKILDCECAKNCGDYAPFVLRVITGLIFFLHGWQKVGGVEQVAGYFGSLDIPLPGFFAYIVTYLELIGGAALIIGFMTHWFAKLFTLQMLIAVLVAHLKNGFFVSKGGIEFALLIFASSGSLMITGAGKWSLDNLIFKKS